MAISIKTILNHYHKHGFNILNKENIDETNLIDSPRTILSAKSSNISFIGKKFIDTYKTLISNSECNILFIDSTLNLEQLSNTKIYIITDNPKQEIINFCKHFLGFQKPNTQTKIHPSAYIHPSVEIGSNTIIKPFVVIEEGVRLGSNCSIDSHTIIKKNTIIGNFAEIGSCNVIGGTGFGFEQNQESKEYEQFPHYGNVIIGNHVSIGNNTCIDRGSLSDTIIEDGVKIDNLVHIAHNVNIQSNSLIIAHAMVAGSVQIGKNCWIAPSSCIRNAITIGDNVTIGLASTVTKSVTSNQIMMGSPALPIGDFTYLRKVQKETLKKKNI